MYPVVKYEDDVRSVRIGWLDQAEETPVARDGMELTINNTAFFKLKPVATNFCETHSFKETRILSTRKLIVPSLPEYHCDILEQCASEGNRSRRVKSDDTKALCPCFPNELVGKLSLNTSALEATTWGEIESEHSDLLPGGHWKPRDCIPRRRVAVIIPFRDRQRHLRAFLAHIHPILKRQLIEYRIFVVEQNWPYTFNKASLMNIGYLEARRVFSVDCVLFHDVDTLIERDDNMVWCGDKPIHFAAFANRHDYKIRGINDPLFGSGTLMSAEILENGNGFSNLYYGWGGEDDDFRQRLLKKKYKIYKGPLEIARSTLLEHERDVAFHKHNLKQSRDILRHTARRTYWYAMDGLNSVKYDVIDREDLPLYTWVHVDLKRPEIQMAASGKKSMGIFEKLLNRSKQKMFKGVDEALAMTSNYSYHQGGCLHGIEVPSSERHYLSRVTCKYICDLDDYCAAVEYHPGDSRPAQGATDHPTGEPGPDQAVEYHVDEHREVGVGHRHGAPVSDDYCHLLTESDICRLDQSNNIELYLKY